jgi:hypothetical protein
MPSPDAVALGATVGWRCRGIRSRRIILAKCFARIVDARATPGIAWMLDSLGDAVDLRFRSADT